MTSQNYRPLENSNRGKSKSQTTRAKNVDQLKNALNNGDFDQNGQKFVNLNQTEQVEIMTDFIKKYMGSNVTKPKSLIDEFYNQNKSAPTGDACSYTEHRDHWNLRESARRVEV